MTIKTFASMTCLAALPCLAEDVDFREPQIVPTPAKMKYESSRPVRLGESVRFVVQCPDTSATAWVAKHAKEWFGFTPEFERLEIRGDGVKGSEDYALSAKADRIVIVANTLQGVRYAMFTLRQAAERESAGRMLKGYWLPEMEVRDSPAIAFRGIHFCWFPELSKTFVEHQIRAAAYYKFNYVVLESWGVFRGDRHPELAVKDAPLTVREAQRLTEIARDLGVTLIPQINVFGHASGERGMAGKHASLDLHPEMQPLFEPAGGWNWCLSNPEARAVVREVVEEMHEAFGNPPFFHIGCDEAEPPSCPTCRAVKPYAALIGAHIAEVAGVLRSRGARAMMWHDMLLEKADAKWKPFYANGDADQAKMIETLPKDIVICDWYYGSDGGGHDPTGGKVSVGNYPTLEFFKAQGHDVLTCPWRAEKGIVAQMQYAKEKKLFGVLETVWHHFRGREFARMMEASSNGAWGHGTRIISEWTPPFLTHWRQVGWDMGVNEYRETGLIDAQVTRDALDR